MLNNGQTHHKDGELRCESAVGLASKMEGKVWPQVNVQVEDNGKKTWGSSHLIIFIFCF